MKVNPRYKRLFDELFEVLSEREKQGVISVSHRFIQEMGNPEKLADKKVMVAYGGGKDSSYTVAFIRAVQLNLLLDHGTTFTLRVANMRHAGVPYAVACNIHRVYSRLELLDDTLAELITVDNHDVSTFKLDADLPPPLIDINRSDILMNGHRTQGDGRPTFCNSCNLSVANFYGIACWWNNGVDVVVTGDSKREQTQYFAWIMNLGKQLDIDVSQHRHKGFKGVLSVLNKVGEQYFRDLYGDDSPEEVEKRYVSEGLENKIPTFVSIYDDVSYRVDEHWNVVVNFLGFEFDDLAFSFTESDCFNPAFMAHLRALKVEHVYGGSYSEGIGQYLDLAVRLMKKKEIPDSLIQIMLDRYKDPTSQARIRAKVEKYISEVFDLNEEQLINLVCSPFVSEGRRLEPYLEQHQPDLIPKIDQIRATLSGENSDSADPLVQRLKAMSGLDLQQIRHLYQSHEVNFSDHDSIIAFVRKNDPHKGNVRYVHPETDTIIEEVVSGR